MFRQKCKYKFVQNSFVEFQHSKEILPTNADAVREMIQRHIVKIKRPWTLKQNTILNDHLKLSNNLIYGTNKTLGFQAPTL